MKNLKKIGALIIALMLVFAMAIPAFATENPEEPTSTTPTGVITVENATYGKTYTAYKIFDATFDSADHDKISYTVHGADLKTIVENATKEGDSTVKLFKVSSAADANGDYTVSKAEGVDDADIIAWVQANYASFDATGTPGTFNDLNNKVTFDVPYGYYYITTTLGSAITIDSNNPDVTVKDKNASAPTDPDKSVVSVDGTALTGDDLEQADAHIGSVIGYKVTGNATNWTTSGSGTSVTTTQNLVYTFEDTFTNMTLDANGDEKVDDLVIKVNGTPITSNYTATISGNKVTFTINLTEGGVATGAVLYQATADNSAYIPIEITYSGTILAAAAGAPAKNEIGDEEVVVNTYAYMVKKTDGTDPLEGAEFELWSNKGDSSATAAALKFIDNLDGTYTYSEDGTVTTLKMKKNLNNEYVFVVKGLDNKWSYTLKEVTVPAGYNQAEDITIAGSALTKVTETKTTSEGTETTIITDTTINSTELDGKTVVNNSGAELPATGGMGTRIFYIVGAILALGAGIVLVTRRRAGDR